MITKLRGVFTDMLGLSSDSEAEKKRLPRFRYSRPEFLDHSEVDLNMSADKDYRPIIVPRCLDRLPGSTGYAECVNAGKSLFNEDQAQSKVLLLRKLSGRRSASSNGVDKNIEMFNMAETKCSVIPFTYFGIFDGHAGVGAAVYAKHLLHTTILENLHDLDQYIFAVKEKKNDSANTTTCYVPSLSELISGALETAFSHLDKAIHHDSKEYEIHGGCTAVVALFVESKLFIANAGDSRAVAVLKGKACPLSSDFTPVSDRRRIQLLAEIHPEWMGGEFCPLEFCRRIQRRDINTKILCRHAHCEGWVTKICTEEDVKFPLIYGVGKKEDAMYDESRLMGTIGVSRGFGDHDLRVFDTDLRVKPFLSAEPDVHVLDLEEEPHPDDVVIIATDGLWDVCSNEMAAKIVSDALSTMQPNDKTRYVIAAQELVLHARGFFGPNGWRQKEGTLGSGDDISVFVIPLNVHKSAVVPNLDALHAEALEVKNSGDALDA